MQLLQANASWTFFALALVFMVWMHSGGGHRHGMGGVCDTRLNGPYAKVRHPQYAGFS